MEAAWPYLQKVLVVDLTGCFSLCKCVNNCEKYRFSKMLRTIGNYTLKVAIYINKSVIMTKMKTIPKIV